VSAEHSTARHSAIQDCSACSQRPVHEKRTVRKLLVPVSEMLMATLVRTLTLEAYSVAGRMRGMRSCSEVLLAPTSSAVLFSNTPEGVLPIHTDWLRCSAAMGPVKGTKPKLRTRAEGHGGCR
jgi:hypothetical protein